VNIENCYYNKDIITSDGNNSEGAITTTEMNALLSNAYTQAKIKTGVLEKSVNLQIGTMGDSNSQLSFVSSIALESLEINCSDSNTARNNLTVLDDYLSKISAKQVEFGAVQNRLESCLEEISVQYDNLVSSRSTLRDADIAEESSKYIQAQILQQASATLMSTANQSPSIALQLI
jgi:flagellin